MSSKTLLFVSAHPDDHLYSAGTLRLFSEKGFQLFEVLLTLGENGSIICDDGSAKKFPREETKAIRQKEYESASKLLGIQESFFFELEDGNVQSDSTTTWGLVRIIRRLKPDIVITLSDQDSHPDHVATSRLTLDVLRYSAISARSEEFGEHFRVPVFWKVEGYVPEKNGFYVDITLYKDFKIELMKLYESQRHSNLVRCMEISDAKNGLAVGVQFAEVFVLESSWPPLFSTIFL